MQDKRERQEDQEELRKEMEDRLLRLASTVAPVVDSDPNRVVSNTAATQVCIAYVCFCMGSRQRCSTEDSEWCGPVVQVVVFSSVCICLRALS